MPVRNDRPSSTIDASSTPIAHPTLSSSCGWISFSTPSKTENTPPSAEQHERDDERVEVADRSVAERVLLVGGPAGPRPAEQQQALIAGVGERVDRFRQHRARVRHEERDELDDGDPEVREERGDDRALRLRLMGFVRIGRCHYSMIPPRVIASTSSARSSCASVISFRARTIDRTDFPVRFDSLMIAAVVS